jgi:hypothetical protein
MVKKLEMKKIKTEKNVFLKIYLKQDLQRDVPPRGVRGRARQEHQGPILQNSTSAKKL